MHGRQIVGLRARAERQAIVERVDDQHGHGRGGERQQDGPQQAGRVADGAADPALAADAGLHGGELLPQRAQHEDHEDQESQEHAGPDQGLLEPDALLGGDDVDVAQAQGHGFVELADACRERLIRLLDAVGHDAAELGAALLENPVGGVQVAIHGAVQLLDQSFASGLHLQQALCQDAIDLVQAVVERALGLGNQATGHPTRVVHLSGQAGVDVRHQRRGRARGRADGRDQRGLHRLDHALAEPVPELVPAKLDGITGRVLHGLERVPRGRGGW